MSMNIEAILSENELLAIISERFNVDDNDTVETFGKRMGAWASAQKFPRGTVFMHSTDYWARFKEEMRLLIYTNDKKYTDVRRKLNRASTESQTLILTTISAAIAGHLGVTAGPLVFFAALTLLAVARVGKNALCQGHDLDVKIRK